jgi:hypothetical protein
MEQTTRDHEHFSPPWGEIMRHYIEIMDEVMPYLSPSEQVVYQRLFRLSQTQGMDFATCRYLDLAWQCGLSLSTLQRAVKSLKGKKLIKTVWHRHGATTFHVQLLSALPHRPAFLPRRPRGGIYSPYALRPSLPPVYDGFSPEDRESFLAYKRSLNPAYLNELRDEALDWLLERNEDNVRDIDIRDRIDELIFRESFGPEKQAQYQHLFDHLYRQH